MTAAACVGAHQVKRQGQAPVPRAAALLLLILALVATCARSGAAPPAPADPNRVEPADPPPAGPNRHPPPSG